MYNMNAEQGVGKVIKVLRIRWLGVGTCGTLPLQVSLEECKSTHERVEQKLEKS